jgi:hypothetical protein
VAVIDKAGAADEADEQACAERVAPAAVTVLRGFAPLTSWMPRPAWHCSTYFWAAELYALSLPSTHDRSGSSVHASVMPQGGEHPRRVEQAGEVDEVRGHNVQDTTR